MATNYTIGNKHFAVKFAGRNGRVIEINETEEEFTSRTKLEMIRGDDGNAFMGRKEFNRYIDTFGPNVEVWFKCDEHGNC